MQVGQVLAQGEVFAGYRIDRLLGAGETAEVYLAHDREIARWVALKVLRSDAAGGEDAKSRFLQASEVIGRLAHPHLITVHARGREGERPWIAMEYMAGSDAGTITHNGPMPVEHALTLLDRISQALDLAHGSGVLHLDIKPSNILLAEGFSNQVVSDFRAFPPSGPNDVRLDYDTLHYAAPELLNGGFPLDQRADVYALGASLFHILTGSPPYGAVPPEQLLHVRQTWPTPLASQHNPHLPPAVDAVIVRAMAPNPLERFASCGEFAAAIRAAVGGTPSGAARTPAQGRRGLVVGITAAVLVVLGAGGAGAFAWYQHESDKDAKASAARSSDAARDAACTFGRLLASVDYTDWPAHQTKILDASTGELHKQFQSDLSNLGSIIVEQQSRSHPTDAQCFVKTADSHRAEVAAIISQRITSLAMPEGHSNQTSTVLTMEFVDGRWLASKADVLTPPK